MARTTATNFSGGLQFPYATAATDLFKKEDVQTLALAVDGHDHSAGKGLTLPSGLITSTMIADGTIVAGDIANSTITGAKIANETITTTNILDGTIATADLAANAITQVQIVSGASGTSTTSASLVDLLGMTVTATFGGGRVVAWAVGGFSQSNASFGVFFTLSVDAVDGTSILWNCPSAAYAAPMTIVNDCGTLSGSHTIKARYSAPNGGTTSCGYRALLVVEYKR